AIDKRLGAFNRTVAADVRHDQTNGQSVRRIGPATFRRLASSLQAERRSQLIACAEAVAKLAKHRGIEPVHVRFVRDDLEIRPVWDTIVRRWTRLTPTRFISTAAAHTPGAKLHREHVVPCRVLVDRMIMDPSECRALLETAVIIASVTSEEHGPLGGIF